MSYDAWMLTELTLTKFRAFDSFKLRGLGRVNLLVGTNNCGKTSVLEGISILVTRGVGEAVSVLRRRGEAHDDGSGMEADPAHLFHGRQIDTLMKFSVQGRNQSLIGVSGSIREGQTNQSTRNVVQKDLFGEDDAGDSISTEPRRELSLKWEDGGTIVRSAEIPLTRRGGIDINGVRFVKDRYSADRDGPPVYFVTTEGLTPARVVAMFEEVVLTPDEDTVLKALQIIEPNLNRLATVPTSPRSGSTKGGIVIRVGEVRVPIGSLGDGIWRLLGIALALTRARGGILLVDEIDTGLHYSVLMQMWELVYQVAKRLDVQVFATTHSRDCVDSLAAITKDERHDISLHRIERGAKESVAFSESELRAAAERNLEVR